MYGAAGDQMNAMASTSMSHPGHAGAVTPTASAEFASAAYRMMTRERDAPLGVAKFRMARAIFAPP